MSYAAAGMNQAIGPMQGTTQVEIPQCVSEIGKEAEELSSLLATLEDRLGQVLRSVPPATEIGRSSSDLRPAMQSQLGISLQGHLFSIRNMIARVNDVLSRLQV